MSKQCGKMWTSKYILKHFIVCFTVKLIFRLMVYYTNTKHYQHYHIGNLTVCHMGPHYTA